MTENVGFDRGQIVWVLVGESGEEPATVKQLGCTYVDEDHSIRKDGVLVQFNVSMIRAIYAPTRIRPIVEGARATRSEKAAPETAVKQPPSGQNLKRSAVTPSPAALEEKKPPAKRKTAPKKTKAAPKKPKIVVAPKESSSESSESSSESEEEDEEDDDKPFQVEYAPTSRSTCRRCDETITKGSVRVSHVPLFRGKPGFQVYRHLSCAIFSEEVDSIRHIGGWRSLEKEDREALTLRIEESKMEVEKENEEISPDELVPVVFQGETRATPPGLTASLLPFQVEGASWMYHQEVKVSDIRGGILADEMGMGKTLQTIVTILDNRPILQHTSPGSKHPPSAPDLDARMHEDTLWNKAAEEWKHEMAMNNIPKKVWPKKHQAARAGTLVICPVIALSQWKSEIEKFTEEGTLTVGVYHGPNRASEMPLDLMKKYDVVLTTYQVLEQDFRKMVSPNKVSCPNCGGKFKIDKLQVHLKYFCGEAAQRTEAQARQRRTADRHGGRGSSKSSSNKKPPMTKAKSTPPMTTAPTKKKLQVKKKLSGCESESDLSIDEDDMDDDTTKRPSRSAAVTATKRVSSSVKEWGAVFPKSKKKGSDDDDSSFGSGDEDDDDDVDDDESSVSSQSSEASSEDMQLEELVRKKRPAAKKSKGNDALARAREKQKQAMEQAKKNCKGKPPMTTPGPKMSSLPKKKGKGKKEPDSSDSDESSDDEGVDPMEGIDMDALVEEAMSGCRFSPLHAFSWWRVVLDEAHFIKSRQSQTSASAFALTSIQRWCLSGTPLQNRVGELYSLIRFLRIEPMAFYFCRQKDCNCKSIHYRMKNGVCIDCGHRGFSHFAHFNKHVLNPIQRDGYTGDGRRAMFKLKNEVLDQCLLRRTKETRAEDMNLPPRIVTIRSVRLHPVEEDFYNALYTQTKASFNDYVQEGTLLNNYAHIFDLLTKMRQAVDHPYLILFSQKNVGKAQGNSKSLPVANGSVDCDMCHEPPTDRVLSSCCKAGFCRGCVIDYLSGAVGDNTPCPSCSKPFSIDLNQASSDTVDEGTLSFPAGKGNDADGGPLPSLKELSHVATGSILRRINLAEFATSTKIEVLVQELVEMRKNRPGSKALVFSQFVNMLDLVRWRIHSDPCLVDLGLGVRILHGAMDVKSRDAALKDFREDPNCRVLLMSLKAAGVALNLTVASECFLLDLWWNPAAEMQAIDRTHRLGQYRPIRAVRFVAEGTVEERVLQLQEKKRLVFDGTIGRDAGSLKMLTVDDMVSLFA